MPELPEIETVRADLVRLIKGKEIRKIKINLIKQVKNTKSVFLREVEGTTIKDVRRRAKILIWELSSGKYLIFHFKMTGQLIYRGKHGEVSGGGHSIKQSLKDLPNKYSHVIFEFSDGSKIFFNDTRQFGWVKKVNQVELDEISNNLGPEPLEINFNNFVKLFKNKQAVIKPLLMNTKFIAGIGNIYASEVLFCAGIDPRRKVSRLNASELKKLYDYIKKILKLAISKKGTSSQDYVDAFGRQGSMGNYLKVYGREGEKCKKCRSKILKIKQAQRSTFYCEKCQK
ncbi:MAG: bifunctional DNA-formamidopyrimidine glycosylase/DNA-(apurinic or apyrimidinic site) lyase [Patescibacteria group bacterium]